MTKIVILEGIDGSGKTTTIDSLIKYYQQQKYQTYRFCGLGSTKIGILFRGLFINDPNLQPFTRYLSSFGILFQLQQELIIPLLNQPQTIIFVDRFIGTNFAYQAYGNKLDLDYKYFKLFQQKIILSTNTIFLDISGELGLSRKLEQKHRLDFIESSPYSYFHEVRKGFFLYLAQFCRGKKLILSGTSNFDKNISKIIKFLEFDHE